MAKIRYNNRVGIKTLFKKLLSPALLLLLVPSLILNFYFYAQNRNLSAQNSVVEVIDGDTLVLKSGQRLRLANLNSPESPLCGSAEARDFLSRLVSGKIVTFDVLSQEVFNRSLAYVYSGNSFVNEEILKNGWARYDGSPSPKREALKAAYDEAFSAKKGIFGSLCRAEEPEKAGCLIKGNIERNTGTKRYHFPGCSEYGRAVVEKDLDESWFCSEAEAINAGFAKAANCLGKTYRP